MDRLCGWSGARAVLPGVLCVQGLRARCSALPRLDGVERQEKKVLVGCVVVSLYTHRWKPM